MSRAAQISSPGGGGGGLPSISVVIPCFNAEEYLQDCLRSVFSQEHKGVEVIVVDGASTDRTVEIAQSFQPQLTTLISEADSGVPEALNKGFRAATGEILCWLNADDVYLSSRVLTEVARLFASRPMEFAYGHHVLIDKSGYVTRTLYAWQPAASHFWAGANIFTGSLFFSRQAWRQFGQFTEALDVAFEYELLRHLFNHHPPYVLDKVLAAFRIHPGTLSDRGRHRMASQVRLLGGERPSNPLAQQVVRGRALWQQGLLGKTIANAVFQPLRGKHWTSFFDTLDG